MRLLLTLLTIASIGLITPVISCGQAYSEADLDATHQAAHEAGYAQGYSAGHDEGYDAGKDDGYDAGKDDGYEAGRLEGHNVGYAEGFDAGLIELESAKQEAEKIGYDKGYEAGIARGRLEAALEAAEARQEAQEAAMARLEDLAYIETLVLNYSDDADPEPEGISLRIAFYDSKSKLITFKDVPLTVDIKLYETGERPNTVGGWLIYQDTITINSSSESIRIPFKDLKRIRTYYSSAYQICTQVTVTTPNQGDFSVTKDSGFLKLPSY